MNSQKKKILMQQLTSGLLFVAVIALIGFLSVRFKVEADWTAGNRNTISDASVQQLKSMSDPITFTAFISPSADVRQAIEGQIAKYQRFKSDIELSFIDPSTQPQKVRELGIGAAGEVVIEYQGRSENLRALSEQTITTALQRLAYAGEQWVVFLEGHGERRIEGDEPDSLAMFTQVLRDKGLKVRGLNLAKNPGIPDNTSVLVVASPQRNLLPGEQQIIADYVKAGGNLLWLADPEYDAGLQPVAEVLGVEWQDGYAIFPDFQMLGTGHPGFFLSFDYPPSPVTQGLYDITVFPLVRSISWQADSGFVVQPFLKTGPNSWLETGPIGGNVTFDEAEGDIPGPLDIGVHLSRSVTPESTAESSEEGPDGAESAEEQSEPAEAKSQRVALVGDSDFITNAYLAEISNQQLGLNLVQWLASRDEQLNIDIPEAPDNALYLPPWAIIALAACFVLVLPLGLIAFGVTRWVIRRRR